MTPPLLGEDAADVVALEGREQDFSPLNVMILIRKPNLPDRPRQMIGRRLFGNPDEVFLHTQPKRGLITPAEVRSMALAELDIGPTSIVWDVGAGNGSVAIEAAQIATGGTVYAIEMDPEDYDLIAVNAERFGVANLVRVLGKAPEAWAGLPPPDAVFVGGTGRQVQTIAESAFDGLRPGGRIVANVSSIENVADVHRAPRTFRIPVAAHLGLTDALTAGKMGVTSIEHLTGVPEAAGRADLLFAAAQDGFFAGWTAFEKSWATLDSVTLTRLAGQLAETGVTMVPTLVLHEVFSRLDDTATAANPDLLDLPANQMAAWNVAGISERAGWTSAEFEAFRRGRPMQDLFVRTFQKAGGKVVTGTDAANQMLVPGASEHTELELLVGAGLTPAQTCVSAPGANTQPQRQTPRFAPTF